MLNKKTVFGDETHQKASANKNKYEDLEVEVKKKKNIKSSTTDPDSGYYHKGEHEKCFIYTHQTISDENGFVLVCST